MKNKKNLGQHWLYNRAILEEIADLATFSEYSEKVATGVGGGNFARETKNGDFVTEVGEVKNGLKVGKKEATEGKKSRERGLNGTLRPLCLEIGPGLGTLTASLLRRFRKVVAVEFDVDLARKLPGSFPGKELEVVNEDILEFDFSRLEEEFSEQRSENRAQVKGEQDLDNQKREATERKDVKIGEQGSGSFRKGDFVVVGNIPYYITSPIIEKLLNLEVLPERIVLLVQKEVAERVASERETLLSLMVKNRAKVELGPVVKREEFTPPPKVDSRVLILTPHAPEVETGVMKLAKIGFSSPRKKLIHNLANLGTKDEIERIFESEGIKLDARPGDLHLEDWQRLHDAFNIK